MARDLDPILNNLDILKDELESDWDEFNDSEANLKRHSISYWKGLTQSIAKSEKSLSLVSDLKSIKNETDIINRINKLGNNIKYHDPLPTFYHKEEKHFKNKYDRLISHINNVKQAILKKKKSHLKKVQKDLIKLVSEINIFEADDIKFFGKILKVRNNSKGLTKKSEIKEFLGAEFKGFWKAAKPYFESHIIGNQGPFIYKGFYNGDQALTITRLLIERKKIYKKFIINANKLSKIAKKEVKYVK